MFLGGCEENKVSDMSLSETELMKSYIYSPGHNTSFGMAFKQNVPF